MSDWKMRISRDYMDEMTAILHEGIQFYDEKGEKANSKVLAQIEKCLIKAKVVSK